MERQIQDITKSLETQFRVAYADLRRVLEHNVGKFYSAIVDLLEEKVSIFFWCSIKWRQQFLIK